MIFNRADCHGLVINFNKCQSKVLLFLEKNLSHFELMIPNASKPILILEELHVRGKTLSNNLKWDNSIISCTQVSKQNYKCGMQT